MNKIAKKIKTFLVFVLNTPLYWISYFTPKNKNLWIPKIKAIWFTKNKQVLKMVKNKGYTACLAYSLKGYLLSIRAKIGVISTSSGDINKYAIGKMKIVQL